MLRLIGSSRRTSPGCRGLSPGSGSSSSCRLRLKSSESCVYMWITNASPSDASITSTWQTYSTVGGRADRDMSRYVKWGFYLPLYKHRPLIVCETYAPVIFPRGRENVSVCNVSVGLWASALLINNAPMFCSVLTGGAYALNTANAPLWI